MQRLTNGEGTTQNAIRDEQQKPIFGAPHANTGAKPKMSGTSKVKTEVCHVHYGAHVRQVPKAPLRRSENRPAPQRSDAGSINPARPSSATQHTPFRSAPVSSHASGGQIKNTRIESQAEARSGLSNVWPMTSSQTHLSEDRSTPIPRSITPSVHTNPRWTPTVQVESRREASQSHTIRGSGSVTPIQRHTPTVQMASCSYR